MPQATPVLRPEIEAVPAKEQDGDLFILYDSSGLSGAQLAVSGVVMFVVSRFDGETSVLDIQDSFEEESGGGHIESSEIEEIIDTLENALFLQGDKFDQHIEFVKSDYANSPVRMPTSAGSAYSDDPEKLTRELNEMLFASPALEEHVALDKFPSGVIIPHIDFARGGAAYAQVFNLLKDLKPPETVVVLGTAHQPCENRFIVSQKDFAIPGGVLKNDADFTKTLIENCAGVADFTANEFLHRGEHSVELQAVWLHHIWGERVKIVPVLVGSVHEYISGVREPSQISNDENVSAFLNEMKKLCAKKDVMVIASADLAHIGPRFGGERDVSEWLLGETEEADRHYLNAIASVGALAGLESLHRHKDAYNICGAGCIYALGEIIGDDHAGKLLGYHQAAAPELQQAVSFASMVFE